MAGVQWDEADVDMDEFDEMDDDEDYDDSAVLGAAEVNRPTYCSGLQSCLGI
jgi:hypothetical protein